MNEQNRPNVTVIYQEAKPEAQGGIFTFLGYLVGIVMIFGFLMGGFSR